MTTESLKTVATFPAFGRKIILKCTHDELKLFMEVVTSDEVPPDEGTQVELTVDALLELIQANVHTSLIDLLVLRDVVDRLKVEDVCAERRIAKGREAVLGRDGKIVWLVKCFTKKAVGTTDARGFTDFSRSHHFDNVTTGQAIARIYPPHEGEDGITVLGNPLKAKPGNAAKILLDTSVALIEPSEEATYHILQAGIDGYVAVDSTSKIFVKPVLEIQTDLDLKVGSIDFIGGVTISGDVHQGIAVKARGDILIKGALQGANVIASGKQVIIKGTHFGGDGGSVTAREGYSVRIARRVIADVDGTIQIEREAIECVMRTRTSINASQAKIVGGEYRLVQNSEFGTIGNDAGNATEIVLCSEAEAGREFADLTRSILHHEQGLVLLLLHLGNYANQPLKIKRLASPHREKLQNLETQLEKLQGSLAFQKQKLKELLTPSKTEVAVPRIQIIGTLFSGVTIRFGEVLFKTEQPMKGPFGIQYNEGSKLLERCAYEKKSK